MNNEKQQRKPGRRQCVDMPWNAHVLLDERHRVALEERAAAEGRSVSAELRRLLDRVLVPAGAEGG